MDNSVSSFKEIVIIPVLMIVLVSLFALIKINNDTSTDGWNTATGVVTTVEEDIKSHYSLVGNVPVRTCYTVYNTQYVYTVDGVTYGGYCESRNRISVNDEITVKYNPENLTESKLMKTY